MKKIFVLFFVCLLLCSCSKNVDENVVNYTYDVVSRSVNMSEYDGLDALDHQFVGVTVDELYKVIDNDSSGVFYLGRTNCACCQTCLKYLNEVAENLNVTIYYLDVYDSISPLTSKEAQDKLTEYLYDILAEVDGERTLQTPTVFSVINGELEDSLICLADWQFDDPPTDAQVRKLENKYTEILKPFSS